MTKMMQQVLDRVNALSPEEQERWMQQQLTELDQRAWLRAEVQKGLNDADAGRLTPFKPENFRNRLAELYGR